MSNFSLTLQHPKPKFVGNGTFTADHGDSQFFSGNADFDDRVLAQMTRIKVEWANSIGIMISGLEPCGVDVSGRQKFKFQEWFLSDAK